MARKGREISSTGIYHVLLRGEDRLFLTEEDYGQFHQLLGKYFRDGPQLFGYCMGQQTVHLLVKEGEGGLSAVIKPLTTSYARYFNRVHEQAGKLFYDRYQSAPVEHGQEFLDRLSYLYFLPDCYGKNARSSRQEETDGIVATQQAAQFAGGWGAYRAASSAMPRKLYLDDYVHMPDEVLSKILRKLYGCRTLNSKVLTQHRDTWEGVISARRLHQLLGETVPVTPKDARKTATQDKAEPKPEAEPKLESVQKPKPKQQLSVWLL